MAATSKPSGFALIAATITTTLLLLLGTYLLNFTVSELKTSQSQSQATKTYYLAESGINEMIYKIKNDINTKNAFLTGTLSATNDLNRNNIFGDTKAAYQVRALSTAPAEAQLIATSTYQIYGYSSRRVVKAYIVKATGSSAEWPQAAYAGGRGSQQNGNITFTGSGTVMTINGGRTHANQNIKIQGSTAKLIINNGLLTSSNNILEVAGGQIILNTSSQEAPTSTIDMPQIDFDSTESTSWKNRATATYTASAFNALPNNTTLNGIIYVNGNINWTNKNLTIAGVLVSNGSINLTTTGQNITINHSAQYGGGLLAKNNITVVTSSGTYLVNGLIYGANKLAITSAGTNFTINGAFVAQDVAATASGSSIIVNYNFNNIEETVNPEYNTQSPIIQINHWEEQY